MFVLYSAAPSVCLWPPQPFNWNGTFCSIPFRDDSFDSFTHSHLCVFAVNPTRACVSTFCASHAPRRPLTRLRLSKQSPHATQLIVDLAATCPLDQCVLKEQWDSFKWGSPDLMHTLPHSSSRPPFRPDSQVCGVLVLTNWTLLSQSEPGVNAASNSGSSKNLFILLPPSQALDFFGHSCGIFNHNNSSSFQNPVPLLIFYSSAPGHKRSLEASAKTFTQAK